MISYLEGVIKNTWGNSCILQTCAGIGYRIILPAHTLAALPDPGENCSFYIYMSVREDAIELFGFDTFEERQTFEILKAINKIGPRTAMSILSMFRPQELYDIVLQDNITALKKVSGIGQKTAQHILLELKYKLSRPASSPTHLLPEIPGIFTDLLTALTNLGYSEEECSVLARDLIQQEPDIDLGSAIRLALRELGKGK